MELNREDKIPPNEGDRRNGAVALLLILAAVLGFVVALASLLVVWRSLWRVPHPTGITPGFALDGASPNIVLLSAILLLLFGIFVLLLLLTLCVCCGCGKERGLLRLLTALVPGLAGGLRTGAKGFDFSADAAHASIAPLHATGAALRDVLGPALKTIDVPRAALSTNWLWDVLHNAHLVVGPRPAEWDNIFVVTSAQLGTYRPFDGPDGLGTKMVDAGVQLYGGGDRAAALEPDLRLAAGGLRAAATALDGQT